LFKVQGPTNTTIIEPPNLKEGSCYSKRPSSAVVDVIGIDDSDDLPSNNHKKHPKSSDPPMILDVDCSSFETVASAVIHNPLEFNTCPS
jgi:hypothetical protein